MMRHSAITGLAMIEEDEARGEVADIYEEVKREMQMPFVPNFVKMLAISPTALAVEWALLSTFYARTTFPESLVAMLMYAIAHGNQCKYCSAGHEMTCRTLGIDEETLDRLVRDLDTLSPERIRAIVQFVLKAGRNPKGVNAADYERLRQHGLTDEEIVELVMISAIGNMGDIIADALKIEVDTGVGETLGHP
jgi:uncharacterized peroxidase-related enzyme